MQGTDKKKLNWTTVLYDHDIFIDSQAYRKWDGNLQFEGRQLLEKDIARTRCNQAHFVKLSTQETLRRLVTFYCKNNKIQYQQGLLQVVIPFALLHRKDFQLRKCYAYFNAFMRRHFPKVLTQRVIEDKKELPHALLAISLSQTLLRYHYPNIYWLLIQHQVPLSMILTQEILTVFAKNTPIEYVYQIYDYYINQRNKNVILYMSVALLGQHQKQLLEAAKQDNLATYANKNIKNITSSAIVNQWTELSEKIKKQTPNTFQLFSYDLGFTNHSVLTREDLSTMMKIQDVLSRQDFIMPIYLRQIQQNPNKYIIASIQGFNIANCQIIKIRKGKSYNEEQVSKNKIVVLSQSQDTQNNEQRMQLLDFAKKLGVWHRQIAYLQEKVPNKSNCIIF